MTAASNSESRKRNAAQVDPVEVVARSRWERQNLDIPWDEAAIWIGPVAPARFRDHAEKDIAALRENGFAL